MPVAQSLSAVPNFLHINGTANPNGKNELILVVDTYNRHRRAHWRQARMCQEHYRFRDECWETW
eukprot:scaffold2536_cov169-Amphora_coffeaeformis.AAC.30